jgi:hypothetical protein
MDYSHAICNLQSAICNLQSAICNRYLPSANCQPAQTNHPEGPLSMMRSRFLALALLLVASSPLLADETPAPLKVLFLGDKGPHVPGGRDPLHAGAL